MRDMDWHQEWLRKMKLSPNWGEEYQAKMTTPEEAVKVVKSGDRVVCPTGRDPLGLGLALAARGEELSGVRLFMATPDELGLPQGPIRVHWDNEFARQVGVPGAYDYGPQRVSWLIHLLTDWMGDDGFIKSLKAQVTRFNIWGDVQFIKGKILEKLREGDDSVVRVKVWAENQHGEVTAKGSGEVLLPSNGL